MKQGARVKDRESVAGRKFIIVIVIVTSALSFTLGYFVGKAGEKEKQPQPQIIISAPQPEPVPQVQSQPVPQDSEPQPQLTQTQVKPTAKEEKIIPEKPQLIQPSQQAVIKKDTAAPKVKEDEMPRGEIKYTVQAGAFKNLKEAEVLKKKLEGKGFKAYIKKYVVEKNARLFKVRTGEFTNKEDAETLANKLKKDGLKAFVTPKNEEAHGEKSRAAK